MRAGKAARRGLPLRLEPETVLGQEGLGSGGLCKGWIPDALGLCVGERGGKKEGRK
jgi:hypothetical protein